MKKMMSNLHLNRFPRIIFNTVIILAISSLFITLIDRVIINKSDLTVRIIHAREEGKEIEILLRDNSRDYYMYVKDLNEIELDINDRVTVYYTALLKVPTKLEYHNSIIQAKFRFSFVIYIELLCLFFLITSYIAIRKREKGLLMEDSTVMFAERLLFSLFGILSILPWFYIIHKMLN